MPGPPRLTEEERRARELERITAQVNDNYREDSFRKSSEGESSYYDTEEEAELEKQRALQKDGRLSAPGEGEDVIKIVPWGGKIQPEEEKPKDREYDPALFGDMKELSMCDLIMIELKHYQTKVVNSSCYKKWEQSKCYKQSVIGCKRMKKMAKKKMQGEFYVDSDPELEEIKHH